MKKLANAYRYEKKYDGSVPYVKALYQNGSYSTKMANYDLPKCYCDIHLGWDVYFAVNAKGIKDLKYTWIKENHFMKDSKIMISYNKPIIEKVDKDSTFFEKYDNVDFYFYGNDILKFLAYAQKLSNFDVSEIRSQIIEQCEWLEMNEPGCAPNKVDDYGKWFDNKMREYSREL